MERFMFMSFQHGSIIPNKRLTFPDKFVFIQNFIAQKILPEVHHSQNDMDSFMSVLNYWMLKGEIPK